MHSQLIQKSVKDWFANQQNRISLKDLARELGVNQRELKTAVRNMSDMIEMSEYNSMTFFTIKSTAVPDLLNNKRMTGEWKPSQQWQDAIARCRADRGGEFSNKSLVSNVKEYANM